MLPLLFTRAFLSLRTTRTHSSAHARTHARQKFGVQSIVSSTSKQLACFTPECDLLGAGVTYVFVRVDPEGDPQESLARVSHGRGGPPTDHLSILIY